jgi:hypothetical protein
MSGMKDTVVEGLLAQIYAQSAQFESYLVLADRYEELGEDERAEFWRENAAKKRCCHWWHYYQIAVEDDSGSPNNPPHGWGCHHCAGKAPSWQEQTAEFMP